MCMTGRQRKGQTRYLVGYLYRTGDKGAYKSDAEYMTKVLGNTRMKEKGQGGGGGPY